MGQGKIMTQARRGGRAGGSALDGRYPLKTTIDQSCAAAWRQRRRISSVYRWISRCGFLRFASGVCGGHQAPERIVASDRVPGAETVCDWRCGCARWALITIWGLTRCVLSIARHIWAGWCAPRQASQADADGGRAPVLGLRRRFDA